MNDHFEKVSDKDLAFLIKLLGAEHVSTTDADREHRARDQSFHPPRRPAVVIWPESTEEIAAVLRFASRRRLSVTPWGAGTSLEGNPIPLNEGILLDSSRLDAIVEVHPSDFQVDVGAGVRYKDLNQVLARNGLFFAPDPGANASIGGMVANNAAGTRTPRYGATRENVLRLEVVLASGEIIRVGTRAAKSASGYDMVHLFIGSEGTLGIITEATLRLAPLPDRFSAAVGSFPDTEAAARAVSVIMGSSIVPAALEFLDPNTVATLNASGDFNQPEYPTLLMEFHSATEAGLRQELDLVDKICSDEGCLFFEAGLGREERDRLWRVRHQTYEILVRNNPGTSFLVVDVAVPVSKYPQLVAASETALIRRGLPISLVGHAGDGNLHPLIPYDADSPESYALALAADEEIVRAALALGGTATGEHGVGIGKRQFMTLEHGASVQTMKAIKFALDPSGILNPGKIFP